MDNSLKQIISKLSKFENDYFSSFSKKSSYSANYQKLLNHIKKNGNINLVALSKEISDKSFIKYISVKKEFLLEKILQSVLNYNIENEKHWKIIKDILYSKILIDKKINEKAKKYLSRAKAAAYQSEEFNLILNIIELEEKLCFDRFFINNYEKLNELKKERDNINSVINTLYKLKLILSELQQFQFNESTYKFDIDKFVQLYGHSPFLPEAEISCITAKSIWYHILYMHSFINQDYHKAFDFISLQYNLLVEYPDLFPREEYLQLMNNYLYFCSFNKNEEKFNTLIDELKNLNNQTNEDSDYIYRTILIRTLGLYYTIGKIKEAAALAIQAEFYLDKKKNMAFVENILIYFNIIRAYINNQNFDKANKFYIKHSQFSDCQNDISIIKLFEFIVHYKLANFDNLLYSVNAWTKLVANKRKLLPIEKVLLKFFRSVSNKATIEEKAKLVSNTIIKLKELEKSEQKYYINHFFDFAAWFERELEEMK